MARSWPHDNSKCDPPIDLADPIGRGRAIKVLR